MLFSTHSDYVLEASTAIDLLCVCHRARFGIKMQTSQALRSQFLLYKGKYHVPAKYTTAEFVQEFEDMEVREDDIFIATYPKSGTHWMQEVVQLILADGHIEKLGPDHRHIIAELSEARTPADTIKVGPTVRKFKNLSSPRVITTHLPFELLPKQRHEKGNKIIYVLRHPKDVIVSYYNFVRKYWEAETNAPVEHTKELFETFFGDQIGGGSEYGDWFDNVSSYYQRKDDGKILFVHFESMKSDLKKVVEEVSSFIGHELDDSGINRVLKGASLEVMRASFQKDSETNLKEGKNVVDMNFFVRKGTLSQWKDLFSKEQNERFEATYREKMKNCELTAAYVNDK